MRFCLLYFSIQWKFVKGISDQNKTESIGITYSLTFFFSDITWRSRELIFVKPKHKTTWHPIPTLPFSPSMMQKKYFVKCVLYIDTIQNVHYKWTQNMSNYKSNNLYSIYTSMSSRERFGLVSLFKLRSESESDHLSHSSICWKCDDSWKTSLMFFVLLAAVERRLLKQIYWYNT